MDTATLGRAYDSGKILTAPYETLREKGLVHWTPAMTYSQLCGATGYHPTRFPGHDMFLLKHDYDGWLHTVGASRY